MKEVERKATTAERLAEAMRDAGKTQQELAQSTGLSHSTISRYRSGLMEPKQKAIYALAALQDPDAPALEKNMLLKKCIDRIEYSRKKKNFNGNRRWGDPEPMELDVHLRV